MQRFILASILFALSFLNTACVVRTATKKQYYGEAKQSGLKPPEKFNYKKTVWIWQDEFRNPEH